MNLMKKLKYRWPYLLRALRQGGADSLPTNIAWFEPTPKYLSQLLEEMIVLVDIGARGLPPSELDPLANFLHVIGFDADRDSAESSKKRVNGRYGKHEIHNLFVGQKSGKIPFNHYEISGLSSSYSPVESFANKYLPGLRVTKVEEVESVTLDEFLTGRNMSPDILKLDVQGSEFDILRMSPLALSQSIAVMVEIEFIEEYLGQGLAHSILELMWERGFELMYLNRVFLPRVNSSVRSRGQLVFGDAIFMRPPEAMAEATSSSLIKYVMLASNFGHWDLALKALSLNKGRFTWALDLERHLVRERSKLPVLTSWIVRFFEVMSLSTGILFSDGYSTSNSDRGRPHR